MDLAAQATLRVCLRDKDASEGMRSQPTGVDPVPSYGISDVWNTAGLAGALVHQCKSRIISFNVRNESWGQILILDTTGTE